jgi:hypothetical protein
MAFFASLLLAVCVVLLFLEFKKKREEMLSYEKELSELFTYLNAEVACCSRPLSEAILSYEPKGALVGALRECIKGGLPLKEAFICAVVGRGVSKESRAIVLSYLDSSGREYLSGEAKRIEEVKVRLSEHLLKKREEYDGALKVYRVISLAVSLGLIILVI